MISVGKGDMVQDTFHMYNTYTTKILKKDVVELIQCECVGVNVKKLRRIRTYSKYFAKKGKSAPALIFQNS